MTTSTIPDLKIFYHILEVHDVGAFDIGMVANNDETFHGRCYVSDTKMSGPRTQRGYDVWVEGDEQFIGSEILEWLQSIHNRSNCHIQMITWKTVSGWNIAGWPLLCKLFGLNVTNNVSSRYSVLPSYVRDTPIDIASLFLVTNIDQPKDRIEYGGQLTDKQATQCQALTEAYINKNCFNKISACITVIKPGLTGELINNIFRSDSLEIVCFIEKWNLGYCLGQAVTNIYNANKSNDEEVRTAYITNALWYLAQARISKQIKKSFDRDSAFYRQLSQSEFISDHSRGNANFDNTILNITVARQYPNAFDDLIEGGVNYLKLELNETTEES